MKIPIIEAGSLTIAVAVVAFLFGVYSAVQDERDFDDVKQPACMADKPNQVTRSAYVDGVPRCIVEERMTTHERVVMLGLKGI